MSYKANQEKLTISSLGKVGSATQADTATTASTASSVADGSITTAKLANGAVTGIKRTNNVLGRTQIPNGNKTVYTTWSVVVTCAGNPVKIYFDGRPPAFRSALVPTSPAGNINSIIHFDVYRNGTIIGALGTQLGAYHPGLTAGVKFWSASATGMYLIDQNPPVGNNTYAVELITDADGGGEYVQMANIDLVVREI